MLALHRDQLLLRGAGAVATVGFACCVAIAGDLAPLGLLVLTLIGALAILNPHTQVPVALMIYLLGVWVVNVPAGWHLATLPAAWCLLVIHVSAALAAAVPSSAPLPAELWWRYSRRLLVVGAIVTGFWLLTGLHAAAALPGGPYAAVAALALIGGALVAHYLLVTTRGARGGPVSSPRVTPGRGGR